MHVFSIKPSRRFCVALFAFGLLARTFSQAADEPAKPLSFNGEQKRLSRSLKLPAAHYNGQGDSLLIDGGQDRRCVLEIMEGSVIADLELVVRSGSELEINGALLRRCRVYAEPKAVVTIRDSGFERCEISGTGGAKQGSPNMKFVNSVFANSGFVRAVNVIGVDMQDCLFLDLKSLSRCPKVLTEGKTPLADHARNPRIRYTTFRGCELSPTLFYTVSYCTFSNCNYSPPSSEFADAGDGSGFNVSLPILWAGCTPSEVPVLAGGVTLQGLAKPIAGNCTLKFTWTNEVLTLDKIGPGAEPVLLATALPASDSVDPATMAPAAEPAAAPKAAGTEVKLKITHMNGLLVMPLPSGKEAGQVSKMNLTALPGAPALKFNQAVGEDMQKALHEVDKFMSIRHKGLPPEHHLEISFEDKYSGKDGPSAAVACALLVESALTGITWDPAFAVTGDMNADGAVQPIGGVAAKVRGATNGSCKIIAVPIKNEPSVVDVLVTDGPAPLTGISIFTIKQFEDAALLANPERPAALQQALVEMENIRSVLQRDPRMIPQILKTPAAAARLQSVLEKAPNCISAKYLLLYAQGRAPNVLTLGGSIEATDNSGAALVNALKQLDQPADSLKPDELGTSLTRLRNLRPKVDRRVWPYLDSLVNFGDLVRASVLTPSITAGSRRNEFFQKLRQTAKSVNNSKSALLADPQIREELGL